MSLPVLLATDRLVFRAFGEEDLDDLIRFHTDTDVQTGYDVHGATWSREEIAARLSAYISDQAKHGFSRWKLSLRNGEFIGRAGLGWHEFGRSVELGYGLLPAYWGRGFAQEAAAALIRWGFEHLRIETIVAFTYRGNKRSSKALAATGMKHVDDRARSVKDGVCAYYEIKRSEAGF